MVVCNIAEVFDTFIKYGLDRVSLQEKVNVKGDLSYCLRILKEPGFPVEVDRKTAVEFLDVVKTQSYFLKGYVAIPSKTIVNGESRTLYSLRSTEEPKEKSWTNAARGWNMANHAMTGE